MDSCLVVIGQRPKAHSQTEALWVAATGSEQMWSFGALPAQMELRAWLSSPCV